MTRDVPYMHSYCGTHVPIPGSVVATQKPAMRAMARHGKAWQGMARHGKAG